MHKFQEGPMALPNVLYTLDGQEWQAQQSQRQLQKGLEGDPKKKLESWKLMLRSDFYWDS